jgi:hypothetical protein
MANSDSGKSVAQIVREGVEEIVVLDDFNQGPAYDVAFEAIDLSDGVIHDVHVKEVNVSDDEANVILRLTPEGGKTLTIEQALSRIDVSPESGIYNVEVEKADEHGVTVCVILNWE